MSESTTALIAAYPEEFNQANQRELVDDLLLRFGNHALGDTIYRVGRDVTRKLGREDRVIGAARFDARQGVSAPHTCLCAAAGMRFRGTDESGQMYDKDRQFAQNVYPKGPEHILREVSELDPNDPVDTAVFEAALKADKFVSERLAAGESILNLSDAEFGRFPAQRLNEPSPPTGQGHERKANFGSA